jgi:hypothetical protein
LDVLLLDGMATSNSRGKLCDKDWCVLSGALGNGRNEEGEMQVRLAKLFFFGTNTHGPISKRRKPRRQISRRDIWYPDGYWLATGWLLPGKPWCNRCLVP